MKKINGKKNAYAHGRGKGGLSALLLRMSLLLTPLIFKSARLTAS